MVFPDVRPSVPILDLGGNRIADAEQNTVSVNGTGGGHVMKFTKMQGCGNDYVYINGFQEKVPAGEKPGLARRLSDRHFGVGSDGVIFINPAEEADFEMEMYNADGTRSDVRKRHPLCGEIRL